MKIFDNFKKKEEKKLGWDYITKEFERIYPEQKNPRHYGTLVSFTFGGKDPLDGISIYDGGDYFHFVTYGLSEIYEKESSDKENSGYGMEFTFKLKKGCYDDEEYELKAFCGVLQSIARYTFLDGEIFLPFEYLYTGQKEGIDTKMKSSLTGFITVPDSIINTIDTVNGKVQFVSFVGVTDKELLAVHNKELTVKELYEKLGTDVTDYNRKSVL